MPTEYSLGGVWGRRTRDQDRVDDSFGDTVSYSGIHKGGFLICPSELDEGFEE